MTNSVRDGNEFEVVAGDEMMMVESDEEAWIKALNYDDTDEGAEADDEWLPDQLVTEDAIEDDEVMLSQGDYDDEVGVVDELLSEDKILKIIDDYEVEDLVFGDAELEDLKRKEKILVERANRGYYRCKVEHASVYNEIMHAIQPYLSDECLRQLHHPYHTQRNEALNKSVATYAPKHKTFSLTESLTTRVAIAAGTQILGYHDFWKEIFQEFGIIFDSQISSVLMEMQNKKEKQQVRAKTVEKKKMRTKLRYKKYEAAHIQDMDDQKRGNQYRSGVAVNPDIQKEVRIALSNEGRNPANTPDDKKRCRYHHPRFCTKLGHSSCSHRDCFMKGKTKQERDEAEKEIREELYVMHKSNHIGK